MTDKEKVNRLSKIITDLWDIFPKETQEEIIDILDNDEELLNIDESEIKLIKESEYK